MFEGYNTCIAATTRSLVKIATPHRLWHQPTRRAWCERKIFKPFCCLPLHIRAQTVQMSHLLILNVILPRTVSITYTRPSAIARNDSGAGKHHCRMPHGYGSHVSVPPPCPASKKSQWSNKIIRLPLGMHFRLARHVRDGLLSIRVADNPCHQAHQHGSHQLRRRSP